MDQDDLRMPPREEALDAAKDVGALRSWSPAAEAHWRQSKLPLVAFLVLATVLLAAAIAWWLSRSPG